MMYLNSHKLICVIFILDIAIINSAKCSTSSSLPPIIRGCYARNFTTEAKPPLTLPMLLELIGKAERSTGNLVPLRILASSIMHGVTFDGIQRNRNVSPGLVGVIPYRGSGKKFLKYKVLVDYFIPGQIELFPANSLALPELCLLHQLVSSTVDQYERGDEITTCRSQSYMPLIEASPGSLSSCPLIHGVLQTKWGPVSIGQVIAGISAGLQKNQVTFGVVGEFIEKQRSGSPRNFLSKYTDVNTVGVATIATAVANAVLNQTTGNPVIGNEGYWNDTILPRAFYLDSHTWDMIEPDILASIDGLVLGTYIQSWLSALDSTRLSQILDMYYSRRGIPYGYTFKASNRTSSLDAILRSINLEQQIIGSAELLRATSSYDVYLTDNATKVFAQEASNAFITVAGKVASKYDKVEYLNGRVLKSPIELIVILDGSYDYYKALQTIYALADGIQVSYHVSSIGVINGQTGSWISNVTKELYQLFEDLNDSKENWPALTSSLSRSLYTALKFYQNKTLSDCSNSDIKPITQAILVFNQDGKLPDNDISESKIALSSLKASYPATRIIYVISQEDSSLKQLIQSNDDVIINFSSDVLSVVTQIIERLSNLPANIVKSYCNNSQVVLEDYVTPQIGNFYEIHREYLTRGFFDIKFKNNDYGDLTVCAFKSDSPSDRTCKYLTVNEEIDFRSVNFCSLSSSCGLEFEVNANNSRIKCAESDCRYPDQVRLNIRYTYAANAYASLPSLLLLVFANILVISY